MKKALIWFTVFALMLCCIPEGGSAAAEPAQYRTLKQGMSGHDVYLLKVRLYQLGYLNSEKATEQFSGKVTDSVRELQRRNGLDDTGIATPELQKLAFSDACIPAETVPEPTPVPTPIPITGAPKEEPELPELDAEGFLPEGDTGEFVYENEEDGLWYYISDTLYVNIRRYSNKSKPKIEWYETVANVRNITPEAYANPYKKLTAASFVSPATIARNNHVVLAISDDTYTWRTFYNRRTGIVIRNGEVLYNTPYSNMKTIRFPRLDVMAFMPDGTLGLYENAETTPEELLAMGVKNVYSFGPILLKDGKETLPVRYSELYSRNREPRCAIGVVSPNHYVILTVQGRTSKSDGCSLPWLAERMYQLGATDAFNLDGGGSAAIVFMGKVLNKVNAKSVRHITDIIGFGVSDLVEPLN